MKINESMHTSRRGSCCDGNNLGTRLKQPTIWTVAETELVSQKMQYAGHHDGDIIFGPEKYMIDQHMIDWSTVRMFTFGPSSIVRMYKTCVYGEIQGGPKSFKTFNSIL